jgi:predicted Zn-dependent protease
MLGRIRRNFRFGVSLGIATLALSLAACTSGNRNSISYILEHEKASFRKNFAKSIGSSPEELQRAFDKSREGEEKRAREVAGRVVARLGRSDDKAMQKHLQAVVARLTQPLNTQGIKYELVLVKDEQINAFTPGGGIIVVQEGLLLYCDTEGQIAAVLAHEIAHVLRRHPLTQRKFTIARKTGRSIAEALTPDALEDNLGKALRLGGGATINAAIRSQEKEADSLAIDILVAADYDPLEMVSVQRVFRQYAPQSSRMTNLLYGSHPLSKNREEAARKKIAENYAGVGGDVTTAKFEKLIRAYQERRMRRMANKI